MVSCQNSSTLPDGTKSRILSCSASGHLVGPTQSCEDACLPFPLLPNTNVDPVSGDLGRAVTLTCFPGHRFPDGSQQVVAWCYNRIWNVSHGCSELSCPPPPSLTSGSVSVSDHYYGSAATYTCWPGYRLPDGSTTMTSICSSTATWQPWTGQDCAYTRCPPVPDIYYGNPNTTAVDRGTVVSYTCDFGYQMTGSTLPGHLVCDNSNSWIGTIPQCHGVACPPLGWIKNSKLSSTTALHPGTVTITCDTGHRIDGVYATRQVACLANGTWSRAASTLFCVSLSCPDPPAVLHAQLNDTGNHSYTASVEYTCGQGYWVSGSKTLTARCEASGNWSNTPQQCDVLTCEPLPVWFGAVPSSENTRYGAVVEYTCTSGKFINDTVTYKMTRCGPDGRWDPPIWACYEPKLKRPDSVAEAKHAVAIGISAVALCVMFILSIVLLDLSNTKAALLKLKQNLCNSDTYTRHAQPEDVTPKSPRSTKTRLS